MEYTILTVYGESIILIITTLQFKVGGTGRGNTGSRVSWYCQMEPLLDTLTTFFPEFQLTDVTNVIRFIQYIIGHIDDNTITYNLPNNTTIKLLRQTAKSVLQSW